MAEMNTEEKITEWNVQKLKNRIIPCFNGHKYKVLVGIPTSSPKKGICLLRRQDEKKEDSLWNIEFIDDKGMTEMWPYDGADSEEWMLQLLNLYVKTGLDGFDVT